MKEVLDDIEIMVKDIKYGQKLELLGHYQDVLKPVHEKTGEISQRKFGKLLGHVSEIAFTKPEDEIEKYDYGVQQNLLTKILLDYLGYSVESKKENGD